jgi:hypothetical protein
MTLAALSSVLSCSRVTLPALSTSAGTYRTDKISTVGAAMNYNKSGANLQGQINIVVPQSDGQTTIFLKTTALSSMAANTTDPTVSRVTVYAKGTASRLNPDGTTTALEGNLSFRFDIEDPTSAGAGQSRVAVTVMSGKDSTLLYSNNWTFDNTQKAWRTLVQPLSPTGANIVVGR